MQADLKTASGYATLALGAAQALTPQLAARAFGLDPLDGDAEWLGRLLGIANLTLGALFLEDEVLERSKAQRLVLLGANAGVTALAAAKGAIPKRTAVSVLAFVAALLPANLAD
jgi:hypothetical protein